MPLLRLAMHTNTPTTLMASHSRRLRERIGHADAVWFILVILILLDARLSSLRPLTLTDVRQQVRTQLDGLDAQTVLKGYSHSAPPPSCLSI